MNKKIIIISGAIAGVFFLLMILLHFLYPSMNKEVVILLSDDGPTKVKPKDPGGVVVPHADSAVYDTLNVSQAMYDRVYVVPDPETPIEIDRKSSSDQPQFLDSIDEILANIESQEESTTAVGEGGSVSSDDEQVAPNILTSHQAKLAEHDEKMILVDGTNLRVFKAQEDRYKAQDGSVVLSGDSGYKIQLSSANSAGDAEAQWKSIKARYAKILKNANLIVKKVSGKNDRIFFLVMAGNYSSVNQAKMVCRQLVAKKQNCIVTK
jgi:hypothetical protein